jgi:hypothetical protein
MKYLASTLAFVTAVAAHGYVSNATIGGKDYTFYQPYQDPYTPGVKRISRPIQGNGPVEDVTLSDLQCGGYTAGGVKGSSPAALHAEAAAGSDVKLYWTLWPESHVGPSMTYMARCPDTGCDKYMPESEYVLPFLLLKTKIEFHHNKLTHLAVQQCSLVQDPRRRASGHIEQMVFRRHPRRGRIPRLHDSQVHRPRLLSCAP